MFISGIILASGFGRRANCDKLSLQWEGKTILLHTFKQAILSALDEIIIVIKDKDYKFVKEYSNSFHLESRQKIKIIINQYADEGMAASTRLGVQNCHQQSQAALFLLADQIFFNTDDINAMCDIYRKNKANILATFFKNERKTPVILSLTTFKTELLQLKGDEGARQILKKNHSKISSFEVNSHLKCFDIDTISDYNTAKEKEFIWNKFLKNYKIISIIGAGGKTSLFWNIAKSFWENNEKCLLSTSTKMWNLLPDHVELILQDDINFYKKIKYHQKIFLASSIEAEKLIGLTNDIFDKLLTYNTKLLIEADGAKEKLLKIHNANEPSIYHNTDLLILVINMDIIGKELSDTYVHRADLLPFSLQKQICSVESILHLFKRPYGYFDKSFYVKADLVVFFNGIESPSNYLNAKQLIHDLKKYCLQIKKKNVYFILGSNHNNDYTLND